jgi:hypothetical protein
MALDSGIFSGGTRGALYPGMGARGGAEEDEIE